MWDKRAEYLTNKDGQSVKMVMDQGFGDTKLVNLRLLGIYSQEIGKPGGTECKQFISEWFEKRNPKQLRWGFVVLTTQLPSGEIVATVTDIANDSNLNAELSEFIQVNGYQ